MRIVSLEPYISELLGSFGLGEKIVAVSHRCLEPVSGVISPRITVSKEKSAEYPAKAVYFNERLARDALLIEELRRIRPDVIVASIYAAHPEERVEDRDIETMRLNLSNALGFEVKLYSYAPRNLEEIYEGSSELARNLKVPDRGGDLGRRAKAQLMDWGDNFYDRMKNKKVTFLESLQPLTLGGLWIPDMIQVLSAHSQLARPAFTHTATSWEKILEFKPDVIVVAPEGKTLKESMSTFKLLEKMPKWDEVPAVKRGEVIFSDGIEHFYSPGLKIIDSFGIMVSAIAGLESGYITKRDSFFRLRWLELQRHKI